MFAQYDTNLHEPSSLKTVANNSLGVEYVYMGIDSYDLPNSLPLVVNGMMNIYED